MRWLRTRLLSSYIPAPGGDRRRFRRPWRRRRPVPSCAATARARRIPHRATAPPSSRPSYVLCDDACTPKDLRERAMDPGSACGIRFECPAIMGMGSRDPARAVVVTDHHPCRGGHSSRANRHRSGVALGWKPSGDLRTFLSYLNWYMKSGRSPRGSRTHRFY